jgi:two-component system, response regulator RegA
MSANNDEKTDRIKLLIIDDEQAYVRTLGKRLTKRNFDVGVAFSGTEGIQAVRKDDYDVAVLDLKMDDMDGIEVLKIFKRMVPNMEVIMVTGHGSETAAREGVDFGAFDYLVKPCELEDLIQKIREAAQKRKGKH